jgi:hypothetical protein
MQMQITELQNNYILKVAFTEENIRQFYGSSPENYKCKRRLVKRKKPTSVLGKEVSQKAILFLATLYIFIQFSAS